MGKPRFSKNWSRTSLHFRFSVLFLWTRKLLFSKRKHQIYGLRKKYLALNSITNLLISRPLALITHDATMSVNSTITNLFWAVIPPVKWWSRIPRLTLRIPCSVYQILFQWNLKTEFQSLVCFRIPWAAGIPDSKEQDSGFHNKKLPDSGNRISPTCSELVSQFSSSFFLLLPKGHQCLCHQVPVLFYVFMWLPFRTWLIIFFFLRYLAIIHSLRYKSIVTLLRCLSVVLFIWILSAVIALIQLSWIDPGSHNVYEEATAELIRKEIIYDAVSLVIFFFTPLVCMAFVYSKIFFEVSRQINNIRRESYPGWQKVEEMKNAERKVLSIFAVMLMVYTVCWLPYFILRFIFNDGDLHPLVAHISTWLRFLTSFLNPCLYILGKKDFRKALSRRRSRDKRCQIFLADPLERSGWSLCHKTKTASEFLVLLVNTYTLSQGRRKGMDAIPSGSFFPLSFFLSFFFF